MASQPREGSHNRRSVLRFGLGAAFLPLAPAIVRAQASDLPSGPIRIILPTQSGGQADTIGRLIGDTVGAAIDRTFIMEPKPGAGGLIAGEYVARAAPDGNTLLFVTGGHTVAAGLYARTIKFDAVKDFAFVCQITEASFAMAVSAEHRAKSFAEILEMSKREPGKITFSSTGAGSTQHLIGEITSRRFGVQWTHVPYTGGAQPLNDVMGGRVDMSIDSMLTLAPLVQAGRMRALAVTSAGRQPLMPDTPAFGELSEGFSVHHPRPRRPGQDPARHRRPPQPGDRQGGELRDGPRPAAHHGQLSQSGHAGGIHPDGGAICRALERGYQFARPRSVIPIGALAAGT
jgi:tripartite-type tricarboxylate transporter receptor subunit TctC